MRVDTDDADNIGIGEVGGGQGNTNSSDNDGAAASFLERPVFSDRDLVIGPVNGARHTHSVVLCHGLYCTGADFQRLPYVLDVLMRQVEGDASLNHRPRKPEADADSVQQDAGTAVGDATAAASTAPELSLIHI